MTRDGKIALALFVGSLATLLVLSARTPLGPASSDYAALVNQAENAVRGAAGTGFDFFASAEGSRAVEQLTKRPLAPLLSAWSALSLGRVGLLDGSSSVRLPWLMLAALVPACVYLQLRARLEPRSAALAAVWLLAAPGFAASALAVTPTALPAWSGWLVLGAAGSSASARRAYERYAWACVAGALAWVAFGLSFAVWWLVPLLIVRAWLTRGRATLRASEHGVLPISSSALLVTLAWPIGVLAFDPLLWHGQAPASIRRIFEEEDITPALARGGGSLALAFALALAGAFALVHSALARTFATGEFRPRRDRSALASTLLLASCACLAATPFDGSFSEQLSRPIAACLVGVGAAFVARRWFACHAGLAEAAMLGVTLLVR